ncbi:hypothetical protein [Streptomyces sp. NL15-2K]|uniref:hypothetical protein n=1 Tax=Streptomyces sp. NL15-2K TaxID=376149 RepID=UPI000FFA6D4D|nr:MULTISPECIES: hypothetical protein [Actinomycetes]WKX06466.1 hypothetical protein Q4V64_02755 [Kutzneria buriramensis]GCB43470.1 hypothetical protein SNL152K_755 [Streptomyces sp. NL15-2K]
MARGHRFHLDRAGHSVTVQTGARSGDVELLVDGKVVDFRRGRRTGVTVLAAELPDDPPQPFTVHVHPSKEAGDVPVCVMETDGDRVPVPYSPLTARHSGPPTTGIRVRPLRWLRRVLRRRSRKV